MFLTDAKIKRASTKFRNIPEHPGTGQIITKLMKKKEKERFQEKAIKEATKKQTSKQTNKI